MRFAVLYSKKDEAGKTIAEQLKGFFLPQILIIELKKESIYSENIDKDKRLKNIEFIIFASKHKSASGKPCLSLHAPGNFRNADYGGKSGKVCKTSSFILKYLFQRLNENLKNSGLSYEATLECTHHGPLLKKPCCFIELGSSEAQWGDSKAAKIIAKTLASLQDYKKNSSWIPSIGIGGPHYCPNFNKIQLNSAYAISHIIPEYSFPLTEAMLKEAIEKTEETANTAVIDWKGCGKSEEKQEILNLVEKVGLNIKRTSEVGN